MRSVPLEETTYRRLLDRATSFDDTPDAVIRRLLDVSPDSDKPPGENSERTSEWRGRARPGEILPEREYWRPILEVITDAGGSAPANDVIEIVGKRIKDRLTDRDFGTLQQGEVRWRNRVRFARLRMTEQELLDNKAARGVWAITEKGKAWLTSN